MKKIIWVCGLIAGFIASIWVVFSVNFLEHSMSMNMRLFFGYASMVLAFSLIYVGVKNYRDNQSDGAISFGKALQISLLITLVASLVYVGIWMIDFYCFVPDFGQSYMASTKAEMIAKGASKAEIQKAMDDIAKAFKDYRNPLHLVPMTFIEIAPVGIVISLIAALILKRNQKPEAANA